MIEELQAYLPFFVADRLEEIFKRCANPPVASGVSQPSDVTAFNKPGGGIVWEFQRTALRLFEMRDLAGPAKSALDRASWTYEKACRHRFAGDYAMAAYEKAQIALDQAVELHQADVDRYDVAREEHAVATARLVQELTKALLLVQRRDRDRLSVDYQTLLKDIIYIRRTYSTESRTKMDLDVCLCSSDLGGSKHSQTLPDIPAPFKASLPTSYATMSLIEPPDFGLPPATKYTESQEQLVADIGTPEEKQQETLNKPGNPDNLEL